MRRVVFYGMLNATDYKGAFNHHFPGVSEDATDICGNCRNSERAARLAPPVVRTDGADCGRSMA